MMKMISQIKSQLRRYVMIRLKHLPIVSGKNESVKVLGAVPSRQSCSGGENETTSQYDQFGF